MESGMILGDAQFRCHITVALGYCVFCNFCDKFVVAEMLLA